MFRSSPIPYSTPRRRAALRALAAAAFAVLFALCPAIPAGAQRVKRLEFRDQPIADILLVLAESAGVSIVPDETVSGNASFFFAESEFEDALSLFLSSYRLRWTKTGKVYHVSRLSASYDVATGLVDLAGDEVELRLLVRALSKAIGKTVLHDALPGERLTVNISGATPEAALSVLVRRFPDFAAEKGDGYYYLRRLPVDPRGGSAVKAAAEKPLSKADGLYSLGLSKGRFLEILHELFALEGKEYSLLTKTDSILENVYFSGRGFEDMLRLVLEQGNADYVESNGIYYVIDLERRSVLRKLKKTEIVPLSYIQAMDLPGLMPSELGSGNLFKLDKNTNSVILTGTEEEVRPLRDFIALADRPLEGRAHLRFEVRYMKAKDLVAILPPKLVPSAPVLIPDSNSFIVLANEASAAAIRAFVETVDRKREGYPVRLRYVKVDEFLKALPPSVSKEDVVDSGSPNLVFFVGSEEKRNLFLRELELLDRPKPQIRYELLVIQYQRGDNLNWTRSLDFGPAAGGENLSLIGGLSKLLSLNVDVVSQFGYQFAAKLSAELGENKAEVFADTTLNGLSGQEIKFQNTSTFRYRETEIDPATGKPKLTGVTREITSGLLVGLNGWVSGDGMITMTVNATVSKRGSNATSASGDPPPTSERVVTTQVRTSSGKPVVIGGLLQKETNKSFKKFPVLGDIPLLGLLFRDEVDSEERTEMVIYVVPHITWGDDEGERDSGSRTERYYRAFVAGAARPAGQRTAAE